MRRIASVLAVERGLKLCAPIHDALLIESSNDQIDTDVSKLKECMSEASEGVLVLVKYVGLMLKLLNILIIWMNKAKKCGIKSCFGKRYGNCLVIHVTPMLFPVTVSLSLLLS